MFLLFGMQISKKTIGSSIEYLPHPNYQKKYSFRGNCMRKYGEFNIYFFNEVIFFFQLGFFISKVEQILKGSLDLIPSPSLSVKIQIYRRKSLLEVIRQNIAGCCQQTFCYQKFVDNAQQCFAFTPQANFPAYDLNFYWKWRWWDQIQVTF